MHVCYQKNLQKKPFQKKWSSSLFGDKNGKIDASKNLIEKIIQGFAICVCCVEV